MAISPIFAGSRRGRDSGSSSSSTVHPPNVIALVLLAISIAAGLAVSLNTHDPVPVIGGVAIGVVLMQSPKIAQQWERAIVLRLGRFQSMRGPGLFWVVPFIDRIPTWIA